MGPIDKINQFMLIYINNGVFNKEILLAETLRIALNCPQNKKRETS